MPWRPLLRRGPKMSPGQTPLSVMTPNALTPSLNFIRLLQSQSYFCILSYFSNPSSGSPKVEMPLAFCLCQLGGPEEIYIDFP
ncbi:hypothetical protein E2C01_059526 [Portunus trituberculatus]|uniref:Uncharacterized protein n=1 Tax=Portunus trituberculatus TaxID=210409 RepID=A0A5B7H2T2_PORTR|nr:hypothetical protein [Portunus trituberculatus]